MIPFIHLDIESLVQAAGYLGMFAIVFAESSLFFCFFLPGGSLLFTAGLLASQGLFNIYYLILILALAGIVGDNVGYWFGIKIGPKLFTREDSRFFKKKHVEYSHEFYEKYGSWALILARFMPIARTFVPILAGVGKMNYKKFLFYNIAGGVVWSLSMTLLGYFLGATVPGVEKYLIPIVLFVIFLTVLPILLKWKNSSRQ